MSGVEIVDMGIRHRKGREVYKTCFIMPDGKRHYSEVDVVIVDRFGREGRDHADRKALERWLK